MEKMLVTQGLNELKTLDARIYRAINTANFIAAAKNSENKVTPYKTKEDFIKEAKSSLDSIKALIKRRAKIKGAIVESNANTMIEVCGEKMSVAKAIDIKNTINCRKDLLDIMKTQYAKAKAEANSKNAEMERKIDNLVETAFGKESKINVKPEDYEAIAKPYRISNEYSLVDPCEIEKFIKEEEDYIENFESTVDQILQVSNCITTIEI